MGYWDIWDGFSELFLARKKIQGGKKGWCEARKKEYIKQFFEYWKKLARGGVKNCGSSGR